MPPPRTARSAKIGAPASGTARTKTPAPPRRAGSRRSAGPPPSRRLTPRRTPAPRGPRPPRAAGSRRPRNAASSTVQSRHRQKPLNHERHETHEKSRLEGVGEVRAKPAFWSRRSATDSSLLFVCFVSFVVPHPSAPHPTFTRATGDVSTSGFTSNCGLRPCIKSTIACAAALLTRSPVSRANDA